MIEYLNTLATLVSENIILRFMFVSTFALIIFSICFEFLKGDDNE